MPGPADGPPGRDASDVTLASYEAAADKWLASSSKPGGDMLTFLDQVAELIGAGTVLELGSGPGWDAAHLETRGLRVVRTDGTQAFVERLRRAGHAARVLDVRTDDFGGPYDGMLACAVLLHVTRAEFIDVLRRGRLALRDDGVLAFTLKEGDGESWSRAKIDLPRRFTYWREDAVRVALSSTGWRCHSLAHVTGPLESWLFVIARADRGSTTTF